METAELQEVQLRTLRAEVNAFRSFLLSKMSLPLSKLNFAKIKTFLEN